MNLCWNSTSVSIFIIDQIINQRSFSSLEYRVNQENQDPLISLKEGVNYMLGVLVDHFCSLKNQFSSRLLDSFQFHLESIKSESKKQQFLKYFSDDKKFPVFKSCVDYFTESVLNTENLVALKIILCILIYRKCKDSIANKLLALKTESEIIQLLQENELERFFSFIPGKD